MPTFPTPGPITVSLELGAGSVRVTAGDRTDTVVEVRAHDPGRRSDATAARQTRVDFADGVLRIRGPKPRKPFSFRVGHDAVDIHIEVPAGSAVRADGAAVTMDTTGRLGECRLRTATGDIRVDEAASADLKSAAGSIELGRVDRRCDVATASGSVRLGTVGDGASVKTANGDIRLADVVRGPVSAQTARGRIEVGIRHGVAVWLDVQTGFGQVTNDLDATRRPGPEEQTVEVKARTAFGDIAVRRGAAQSA